MSSPIAINDKSSSRKTIIKVHQKLSHHSRIKILANKIIDEIDRLFPNKKTIKCLDVGCGDMVLAEIIEEMNPKTEWKCIDIYQLPENLKKEKKWEKYSYFDGETIPFPDDHFDIILFCDVLHHVDGDVGKLIQHSITKTNYTLIKDHFEYSFYSRQMLRLMDFVGNWGYGVSVPKNYFQNQKFKNLLKDKSIKIENLTVGIDLYSHLPVINWFLKPNWQFISSIQDLNKKQKEE